MARKNALGKGLNALINDEDTKITNMGVSDSVEDKEQENIQEEAEEAEEAENPESIVDEENEPKENPRSEIEDNEPEQTSEPEDQPEEENESKELSPENQDWKEKYLRLSAEFDNYRKRTLKEKMELMKSAGEDIFLNILPVIDDFERGLQSINDAKDTKAVKEGVELIYNKFKEFINQRGVKEIDAKEKEFDTDLHEAVTKIPAPDKRLKGKVVDVIEKGYTLNDKVIRYAKVVIGE